MQRFSWRRLLTLALVAGVGLAVPEVAQAQTGKLTGVVTDASTGQPIEGAQVVVAGTGYGAVTQSNGRYFIVAVPPGTYTVTARRIGYQSTEVEGVRVAIDVTREVNFQLNQATTQLAAVRVAAPPTPLVEQGVTGSGLQIPTEVITALPVTDVGGVLALQQGFLQVPQNTDIVSFSDTRRNVMSPLRIRGGRGGETLTLIDGIPVNNYVFGGPALNLTTSAVQQLDYQKGGFEPQYGNALSGIINIATREGGNELQGNLEYQTTRFAGELGSDADAARGYDLYRGHISGPIPGTANRLRFVVAGQQSSGADQALEFDQDVYDFDRIPTNTGAPEQLDLFPGWRGVGYDLERQLFGKLTFIPTTASKLNLLFLDYGRQRQPFDVDYILSGFDPLRTPTVSTLEDTLGLAGFRGYRDVVQGSILADRSMYGAVYTQRFGRTNLEVRAARFDQQRTTCNFFQGICLGARFADINFNDRFVAPGITQGHPASGTDEFFGGEDVSSTMGRIDVQSQVTDHHNLQGGVFYQRHDLNFSEFRNQGTNDVFVVPGRYRAKPYEAAAYLQDRIEYDFLTVKLGFRFDYGQAAGSGFANPLDPTNGTTITQVCSNPTDFGLPANFAQYTFTDPETGETVTLTGAAACTAQGSPLRDTAVFVAQLDDFVEADPRIAFSPRIGVSFPLSERSSLFFNAGRYTQNPLFNNLYQNTGVGVRAGPAEGVCEDEQVKPLTSECYPTLAADAYTPAFIGNPNLLLEQTTAYEIGYAAEFGTNYAVNFTLFSKDQTGLTGIRRGAPTFDVGTTYNNQPLPNYFVVVNQDYTTVRGLEVQFRRRIANHWGYDVNYSFSTATTNAAPPDRQQQNAQEGIPESLREIRSEIDQPHVFNASLFFRWDDDAPNVRYIGEALANTSLTFTARAASGLPYTPLQSLDTFGNFGELDDVNSGRAPSTFSLDLLALKDFRVANVDYGAFLRVVNLTDRQNCVQVYPTTGRCDAGTVDERRQRQGNNPSNTSTYFDRPEYFGQRRTIYTGVRVNF